MSGAGVPGRDAVARPSGRRRPPRPAPVRPRGQVGLQVEVRLRDGAKPPTSVGVARPQAGTPRQAPRPVAGMGRRTDVAPVLVPAVVLRPEGRPRGVRRLDGGHAVRRGPLPSGDPPRHGPAAATAAVSPVEPRRGLDMVGVAARAPVHRARGRRPCPARRGPGGLPTCPAVRPF